MAGTKTAVKKGNRAVVAAASNAFKDTIRKKVTDLISTKFASTLGQMPDVINLVMSLIHVESAFRVTANSGTYGYKHESRVLGWSAVKSKYESATELERRNIKDAVSARGLMQCTGYYVLRGAGPSGKCEIDRLRPDLAPLLVVPLGTDVSEVLNGIESIDRQLLAGLIVLEEKYKNVSQGLVKKGTFKDRTTATFAAYLGLGTQDKFGSTPQGYADKIIRGDAYIIANPGVSPNVGPLLASGEVTTNPSPITSVSKGPEKTVASAQKLSMSGCAA